MPVGNGAAVNAARRWLVTREQSTGTVSVRAYCTAPHTEGATVDSTLSSC